MAMHSAGDCGNVAIICIKCKARIKDQLEQVHFGTFYVQNCLAEGAI